MLSNELEEFINFSPSRLKYKLTCNNEFKHNYNKDLQFYILWENGRGKQKEIMDKIAQNFKIIYCAEIHWSEENRLKNFNRIYSQSIDSKIITNKYKTIGMGPFLCIVYEDPNPKYRYLTSLSGEVFLGNVKAVELKHTLRNMLDANYVHGSSNISEFFLHASLIFHAEELKSVILRDSWDRQIHQLKQDLAGANGWKDFNELFTILNYCSDWAVLRNYEYLPDDFWGNDKDIDLLCDNVVNFVSAANALKMGNGYSSYITTVNNQVVPLDIRYQGDNYYDPVWQYKMLERKLIHKEIVPHLRWDDYFFSLLYHAKLQKKEVKDEYVPKLLQLSQKIGLNNIDKETILDDKSSATIINGFLNKQGYLFHIPNDKGVYLNKSVYKFITAKPMKSKVKLKRKIINFIAKKTPKFIKTLIPNGLKKLIKGKL